MRSAAPRPPRRTPPPPIAWRLAFPKMTMRGLRTPPAATRSFGSGWRTQCFGSWWLKSWSGCRRAWSARRVLGRVVALRVQPAIICHAITRRYYDYPLFGSRQEPAARLSQAEEASQLEACVAHHQTFELGGRAAYHAAVHAFQLQIALYRVLLRLSAF